jgi:tRNA (guanosine-2'-O-)-methyltransferase
MDAAIQSELTEYLSEFISEERLHRIDEVLNRRTRHLCVVLEDLYQSHNASAVLRSCDGFGIQDVHIIENRNRFDASSGVTIGADQWLTLHRHNEEGRNNTEYCFHRLKEEGFTIVATTPHTNDISIDELPVNRKTALVFGAELEGLSKNALDRADEYAHIPMQGFSESFNISVSAALCLYDFSSRMRRDFEHWPLKEQEKNDLRYTWIRQSVKAGSQLEKRFLKQHYPDYLGKR